jgi:ribosomal protein S18 acetylase RimI-like enzyme
MREFALSGVAASARVSDREIEELLHGVYVKGGFTDPVIAETALQASAVRDRGELTVLCDPSSNELVGMVMLVGADSAARRLAGPGECEMHLLAVKQEHRGRGYGELLVDVALERARALGAGRMLLWTQPSMHAAQRLYARVGFERQSERDFRAAGREFWVMKIELAPAS